ncbi:MAG: hypothetical protein IJH34_03920 [Romboutsia sp.]|nr:hypothetical protein [Romboutsia sp.]
MKEVQKLYNQLTNNIESLPDLMLRMNDLYSVQLKIAEKAFNKVDNKSKSWIIDSLKPMTNKYITDLMKLVSNNELTTIDK